MKLKMPSLLSSANACRSRGSASPAVGTDPFVRVTPEALGQIFNTVGTHEPETGGVLFEHAESPDLITKFVFDEGALSRHDRCVYEPSWEDLSGICEDELKAGLTCCGNLHSHPDGADFLSTKDVAYASLMFAENLRLSTFTMAILLGAPLTSSLRGMPTQAVANSTLKFFIVHRDRPTAYQHARIIIADESTAHRGTSARQDVDLKGLAKRIGGKVVTSGAEINGSVVPCITVTARGTAVSVYLPAEFPFLAPTVIVRPEGEGDFAFPVGWKLRSSVDLTERLRRLISAAVAHVGNTF